MERMLLVMKGVEMAVVMQAINKDSLSARTPTHAHSL